MIVLRELPSPAAPVLPLYEYCMYVLHTYMHIRMIK